MTTNRIAPGRIAGVALLLGGLVAPLTASVAAAPGAAGSATAPVVSAGDTYVVEGTGDPASVAKFPVTLAEPASIPVSVSYTFTAGSANLSDFDSSHGTRVLKFKPTAKTGLTPTVKYVTTTINPDATVELGESFHLVLSAPSTGATLGRGTGDAIIINDDPTTAATVSVGGGAMLEGDAGALRTVSVPVRLSTASAAKVQISYRISGGTAEAPGDFTDFGGKVKKLTFAPTAKTGLTTQQKYIPVKVVPDLVGESDETVTVTLLSVTGGYSLARDTGEVTILNDDGVVWSGISAGRDHTCALVAGASFCWGLDGNGELGNGETSSTANHPVPTSPIGDDLTQVVSGDFHTCARSAAGGAWCWGMNIAGQLGDGSNTDRDVPIPVTGLGSGVMSVGAGTQHSCAVTTGGAVSCWGQNLSGELGDSANTPSNVPVPVTGLGSGVAAVAVGSQHTCALTDAGGVWCWGANNAGQLGNGTTTGSNVPVAVSGLGSGVAQIAAGDDTTCAVTDAGAARCWGANGSGQLGDGSTVHRTTPVGVSGLGADVAQIAAGGPNACAVTTAGAAWCWGSDLYGQLGDGQQDDSSVPIAVTGFGTGAGQITVGTRHACLVATTGAAYCWGSPNYGALGNHSIDGGGIPGPVDDP